MYMIGIAGGSGSGKTTFAQKVLRLSETTPESRVGLISQDSYYLKSPPLEPRVHGEPNFDHPDAFDWPLLRDHLRKLKQGEPVQVPVYDYVNNRRSSEVTHVGPCRAVVFEGIFALWDAEVRGLFDLRVYLHVDADIRFIRRLHRDVKERGRTVDSIIRQYYDSVRPMHREFLEPTQQFADLTVGEETDLASEVIAARILQVLK